jgi:peroxiredoxin
MNAPSSPTSPRKSATKLFLSLLGAIAVLYGVVLGYHLLVPEPATAQTEPHWLEQCRQVCLQYGLVPTGNIKADAEAYLAVVQEEKLSAPLEELLNDAAFVRAESEEHPLLGKQFLDFQLTNSAGQMVSLSDYTKQGPVVLVFYYGYTCSHCVAQLIGLQEDLKYFHELGAEIVAFSPDTVEFTQEKYKEYGAFEFPVLADPDYAIAEKYGVFAPATPDAPEDLLHGTFVIDETGKVIFANRGYQPFVDNKSLLYWLAGRGAQSEGQVEPAVTAVSR